MSSNPLRGTPYEGNARLVALARPSLRLVPVPHEEGPAPGTTRFGGSPDLAPGTPWPTTRAGDALTFLAQVSLADAEGLSPAKTALRGHLAFFVNLETTYGHASGFDDFRVLHVTGEGASCAASPVPEIPAMAARGERALTLPTAEELDALGVAVDGNYQEVRNTLGVGGHRLFGHGDFIQNMPLRSFEGAVRTYPDRPGRNPFTGEKIVIRGRNLEGVPASLIELLRTPATWLPLLQLDTDSTLGFEWGDAGRIWFLVREDDWSEQRFDRMWIREDSY